MSNQLVLEERQWCQDMSDTKKHKRLERGITLLDGTRHDIWSKGWYDEGYDQKAQIGTQKAHHTDCQAGNPWLSSY